MRGPRIAPAVLTLLALLSLLTGCQGEDPRGLADGIAAAGGFRRLEIQTPRFTLLSFVRGSGRRLRVYIEGDGHAWRDRDTPSDDPTPWRPVALELAARDNFPAVVWLGRPCQYVKIENNPPCAPVWWTDRRYHEAVILSVSDALDQLRSVMGARWFELVGFSGGGVIAALVAARRHDIVSLRTVAANLDTTAWIARHGLSPLHASLNPANFAARLARLPQLHFVSTVDNVVEPAIIRAFLARLRDHRCARMVELADVAHDGAWPDLWPYLIQEKIGCL